MAYSKTPAESVKKQHQAILNAIQALQAQLDKMTGEIDPETTSWADANKFGHVADIADQVIERLS